MLTAGQKTISDIFNGRRLLNVPFFQRSYVWKEEQWERLLDDLETITRTKTSHFIGSVILKQQLTDTSNQIGDIRTLIDGQQRLTTLMILLKVLCLKIENLSSFDRQFRISKNTIAIQHNRNDMEAFNWVMALESIEEIEAKETDNITKAYSYFYKNLDPLKVDFDTVCDGLIFVGIDLSSDEDEQQIFDTINSLGVRLTTAELLKNYFFGRDDVNLYEKYWLETFEKDDEVRKYWDTEFYVGSRKRTFIDQLFFSFLQIKIQDKNIDVSSEDKLAFSKLEQLFNSYKRFVKTYCNNDKHSLLDEIAIYAKTFRKCIDINVVDNELQAEASIERLTVIAFALETTTLLTYILFVEKNVIDSSVRNELYGYLESYLMRRICCRSQTKGYSRLFAGTLILHNILSKQDFINFITKQEDGMNQMPDNNDLHSAFNESRLTNKQTRGIIYMIESKIRDRNKHSTQLLGINKYSLEHIMPKQWRNNWVFCGNESEAKERDGKLLTLGNLAIITQSLNSSIRDADWKTKKIGKGNNDGLKTYSQGIETMSKYLELDSWNESTIKERADWLCENALENWKYE